MGSAYRDETECLRAENVRLMARVAEMEAKPKRVKSKTRWGVPDMDTQNSEARITLALGVVVALVYAVIAAILFIGWAHLPMTDGIEQRGGIVFAILAALWCLAFVRRVALLQNPLRPPPLETAWGLPKRRPNAGRPRQGSPPARWPRSESTAAYEFGEYARRRMAAAEPRVSVEHDGSERRSEVTG